MTQKMRTYRARMWPKHSCFGQGRAERDSGSRNASATYKGAIAGILLAALAVIAARAADEPVKPLAATPSLRGQTQAEAEAKSSGCVECHKGIEPMHASAAVKLGCTDCHGGNPNARKKEEAHVKPLHPEIWKTSANPERSYTALLKESPEFVRFVNPGDLRVAPETCGGCHPTQTAAVPRSTMTTSAVFWAAASYANGLVSQKRAFLGESYDRDGKPRSIKPAWPPTPRQVRNGALPILFPLPRWETLQPGEYFRAFERGGINNSTQPPDTGNPNIGEEAGRPDIKLGNRGRGAGLRITPGLINIHKTRLNDPHLSFLGTNDHPGDYRSSGCTACHVVYANDRDPLHSAAYARFGNDGRTQTGDVTIPKNEKGHPLKHRFTRAVPTSQCMSCHMHQPNSFVNTYLGYTMWDYETDAALMFPKEQRKVTEEQKRASLAANPEGAAVHGLWNDSTFLENVSTNINPKAKNTQFADYHGHGWNFMAVYKRDRHGSLLDSDGNQVSFDDPDKFHKAVHLQDIHLEKGMHCVDCHFSQDEHGNGQIYGEYANDIEIECEDCHGTVSSYTTLRTSGPSAPAGGTDLRMGTTPFGQRRFAWIDGKLYQRSMLNDGMQWEVVQVKDSVTPGNPHYNEKSRYAKTIQRGGAWGDATATSNFAHSDSKMTCYACHTSWMTSCSGCHLPQEQNAKTPMNHYEGIETRNYASYNPQVIRTDTFMLGVNGTTKGHRLAPVRSSSALMLSSTNALRDRIYLQQPPISAPGYSSQAFNAHVPHTVRTKETQGCDSCHVSKENDNNAWLAQLSLQGTNFVNFVGRYAWVATGRGGLEAVEVTEWDEPQAVIGSSLQKIVYPDDYAAHEKRKLELGTAYEHHGNARSIQMRGEYVFTASGEDGFVVYDVANIDNKDFSERITSAPVSPLGQRTYVKTQDAAALALPTTMPMAPDRKTQFIPENEEQPIHPLYKYAYIADREEGLVLVDVTTLTDGSPSNNFLTRALTFNPNGLLKGAQSIYVAGRWLYIGCDRGLVIVDIDEPLEPKIIATLGELSHPSGIAVQFRYAFVTDANGFHTIDVTDPSRPQIVASLPVADARSVYAARTYAYVGGGSQGIVIIDIEKPDKPVVDQIFNADGALNDTNDVKVASTNASTFAYVADGKNGLRVVQLTSPEWTPTYAGFSPRPAPRLIATKHTDGPALSVSKGLDRDRAVDESGNQVSIFNRIGARPMTYDELRRLYLRDGQLYSVSETPETEPVTRSER